MNENRSSLLVPLAIIVGILIVAGAFYYQSQNPNQDLNTNKSSLPAELEQLIPAAQGVDTTKFRPVDNTDKILGSISAPIKLVVYTDLECPACKYFHTQIKQLEAKYVAAGPVAIIYRNFPLDQLHTKARTEALAAECINEVGGLEKYWQFIDKIFEITPSNDGLDPAKLGETAKILGVDTKTFESCMTAKKYADKISISVNEAVDLGAPGTPTSILIDSKGTLIPITVALPAERLAAVFDILIQASGDSVPETGTSSEVLPE